MRYKLRLGQPKGLDVVQSEQTLTASQVNKVSLLYVSQLETKNNKEGGKIIEIRISMFIMKQRCQVTRITSKRNWPLIDEI